MPQDQDAAGSNQSQSLASAANAQLEEALRHLQELELERKTAKRAVVAQYQKALEERTKADQMDREFHLGRTEYRQAVDYWKKIELNARMMAAAERRRLAEQQHSDVVLCAACGKRSRHFDDLCKRCANANGIRPTGKVT